MWPGLKAWWGVFGECGWFTLLCWSKNTVSLRRVKTQVIVSMREQVVGSRELASCILSLETAHLECSESAELYMEWAKETGESALRDQDKMGDGGAGL